MNFINGITLLLVYQLLGEALVIFFALPVPGPVVGMILLFLSLLLRGRSTAGMDDSSNALLNHLSLLFVPAGVGLMVHLNLIVDQWLPILLTLVLSTLITLTSTAGIFWISSRLLSRRER